MEQIAQALAQGPDLAEAESLRRHLADCATCRRQLTRMNWLALAITEFGPLAVAGHLADLEAAAYADGGALGPRLGVAEKHLAACDVCVGEVADTRRLLDATDEVLGRRGRPSGSGWPRRTWTIGCSTPGRFIALLGAAVSYTVQCALFATALAHMGAWVVLRGAPGRTVPGWGPLVYLSEGWPRLVGLVIGCVVLALLARFLARRLYRRAIRGADGA